MTAEVVVSRLNSADKDLISQIANWYLDEWAIPTATTTARLAHQPNDDVLFQLVLTRNNKLIATGGLYNRVGLLSVHQKFMNLKPWVALLYTDKENRNQGIGQMLLTQIEDSAKKMGLDKIYLFTFTAESLYKRSGWSQVERVIYKGHDTVVMEKKM